MGGMEVERERDKGARGHVQQQELRGPSHYDSAPSFMPPGLDHNLKAPGQTKGPGKPGRTAVSQGTNAERGEEGVKRFHQHPNEAAWNKETEKNTDFTINVVLFLWS